MKSSAVWKFMVRRQSTFFSPVPSPSHLCSVYSESDDHAHSHHEILLTSFPLALEWMDFDPEQPDKKGQLYIIRLSSCSQPSTSAPVFSTLHTGSTVLEGQEQWSRCLFLTLHNGSQCMQSILQVMIAAVEDCKLASHVPLCEDSVFVTLQATTLWWAPCATLKCGTSTS